MRPAKITMRISGLAALAILSACTANELPDGGEVYLRPSFYTGALQTRSIVTGMASNTTDGNINQVALYVTNQTDNAAYTAPGLTAGKSTYTNNGSTWAGDPEIKLSNVVARIYAFHPASATVTPGTNNSADHTIPVSVTADLKFNGANNWQCNGQEDYLYGSKSSTTGATDEITASNASGQFKPAINMQHALSLVVFKMQTASSRPVDATYDYVKKLTLTATSSLFKTGTGTMLLKDGTLQALSDANTLRFSPDPESSAVLCGPNNAPAIVGYGLVAPLASQPASDAITLTVLLGKQGSTYTENERELTVTLPNPKWEKGNQYTYNLTLSNRNITIEKIDSEPIKGWGDESGAGSLKPEGF